MSTTAQALGETKQAADALAAPAVAPTAASDSRVPVTERKKEIEFGMLSATPSPTDSLTKFKARAMKVYAAYQATQTGFVPPVAEIQIEDNSTGIEVHMDTVTPESNIKLHFESIKMKHLPEVYRELYSQPVVWAKYVNGKVKTEEETQTCLTTLSDRFKNKDPYSAFAVTDTETRELIGMATIGYGDVPGEAEMAMLNTRRTWNHHFESVVREHGTGDVSTLKPVKLYSNVGTTEVCTMLQFGQHVNAKGYEMGYANGKVKHPLTMVTAVARLDNPSSWKTMAKSGMRVVDVNINKNYGPEYRFKVRKSIT